MPKRRLENASIRMARGIKLLLCNAALKRRHLLASKFELVVEL